MSMSDDRYEIVWFRGHRFDRMTVQALMAMEKRLGYELTVIQGSYNGTAVSASGGTHAGGAAVDLAPYDAERKQRIGREVGFAMWDRPELWQSGNRLWGHHVHGILIGNDKASPAALRQVTAYRNHRDGLAGNRVDNTWHPAEIKPYAYYVEPYIAVDLSNLRIDFFNALEGHGGNSPKGRVKVVQRRLNRKFPHARGLVVDGIVGRQTLDRWGAYEKRYGHGEGRVRIPDMPTLRGLLRGSVYYAIG